MHVGGRGTDGLFQRDLVSQGNFPSHRLQHNLTLICMSRVCRLILDFLVSGGAPMEDAPLQRTKRLILLEWDFGDLWGLRGLRKSRRPLISRVVEPRGIYPNWECQYGNGE